MVGRLSPNQSKDVLQNNFIGRIGYHDGLKSYIVPVNYLFDGQHIIIHSREGLKIRIMRRNPDVCFEVDEISSFTNWKSVIAWGKYEEIKNEKERKEVMDEFVRRMLRLKVSDTAQSPETSPFRLHPHTGKLSTIVYKIVIETMTGMFEKDTDCDEGIRETSKTKSE
jgi:hypothetical protein